MANTKKRSRRPGSSGGGDDTITTNIRPIAASKSEILMFLQRLQRAKDRGVDFEPQDEDDYRLLRLSVDKRWVSKRGRKHLISQLGLKFLHEESGAPYMTQMRALSSEVYLAKVFQAEAKDGPTRETFQMEDVVRVWAAMVDYRVFRILRGVGVELGHTPEDAAGAVLRAIADRFDPEKTSALERDRLKTALFSHA